MKKIILMMLLMTVSIFAVVQDPNALVFYVDSSDMVDMYFLVFSAIGRIFKSGDYIDLLRLVFLVGGVMVFAGGIFKSFGTGGGEGAIGGYIKYLIIGVALLTLVFWNGHTPILLKSKYFANTCDISNSAPPETMGAYVPDGVPTLVAYGYYFTNQIGTVLTDLAIETYSTVYNDPFAGMTKNDGYMGALKGAMRVMAIDPSKISLRKNDNNVSLLPYDIGKANKALFTDCILVPFSGKGSSGEEQLAKLKSSSNLTTYLKGLYEGSGIDVGGTNSRTFSLNYNGEIMNCGKFYDDIIKPINDRYASELSCGMPVGLGAIALLTGASTQADVMSSFDEVAIQSGLVSQLEESTAKLGVGVSGVGYASGKTRAEFIQTSLASGSYMAEMLPFLQMTIRAILYAFFPFVFVIILLPGGIKVLGNYVQSLIWIELWSPTAAILDLFMTSHAKSQIGEIYGGQGLTMMSSIDMLSAGSTIAGVAGYLYMSVPALTWLILKGSAQMLQGIGSAAAAGMSRNITTDAITRDQGKLAKQKEASARAGKDISMAEMQHYEAVQAGRMEGATLGLQMKAGMDTVTDMESAKTQSGISRYLRTAEITKTSGEHQGKPKGYHEATKDITAVKTGAKKTKKEQDGETEADKMKDVGKARSKTKNVDDGTITTTKEENIENADQADRNAKGNASAHSGKNKRERAATKKGIAETAKNDAQYNDNNHADAQGASEGEQNKRNTDSDRVQRNAENAAGIGPNQIGNSRAMTTGETIAAQNAFKQIMQNSGKWDNNKTDVENMRALKKEQAMFQKIADVDENGDMTLTIRDQNGNLQHQTISAKNIKDFKNFGRQELGEIAYNKTFNTEADKVEATYKDEMTELNEKFFKQGAGSNEQEISPEQLKEYNKNVQKIQEKRDRGIIEADKAGQKSADLTLKAVDMGGEANKYLKVANPKVAAATASIHALAKSGSEEAQRKGGGQNNTSTADINPEQVKNTLGQVFNSEEENPNTPVKKTKIKDTKESNDNEKRNELDDILKG